MLNMSVENQVTFEQKPIAYFLNGKGAKFAAYDEKQVKAALDSGYKQVEADAESIDPIVSLKPTEKVG